MKYYFAEFNHKTLTLSKDLTTLDLPYQVLKYVVFREYSS